VTLAAKHCSAHLGLEWHLVVLPAIVANDLESLRRLVTLACFFRPAFRATLWGHHVALVKHFLFLFGKQESLLALNAHCLNVRHILFS
jgi:hypothetical protein